MNCYISIATTVTDWSPRSDLGCSEAAAIEAQQWLEYCAGFPTRIIRTWG